MTENEQIKFDSSDWNSIRNMIKKINEAGQMLFGETEEGERIHYSLVCNGDMGDVLKTDVFQHNGWIRTNYYDPTDYTIEEMYKKEK